jgi:hypothetical protein
MSNGAPFLRGGASFTSSKGKLTSHMSALPDGAELRAVDGTGSRTRCVSGIRTTAADIEEGSTMFVTQFARRGLARDARADNWASTVTMAART